MYVPIDIWEAVRKECKRRRHSFVIHLIENGYGVSTVQSLLGHKSPTTMINIHTASSNMIKTRSPLDNLE